MLADLPRRSPLPLIPRAELPVRVGALSPSAAQPPGSASRWTHPADELLARLRGRDEFAEGLEGRVGQTYGKEEAGVIQRGMLHPVCAFPEERSPNAQLCSHLQKLSTARQCDQVPPGWSLRRAAGGCTWSPQDPDWSLRQRHPPTKQHTKGSPVTVSSWVRPQGSVGPEAADETEPLLSARGRGGGHRGKHQAGRSLSGTLETPGPPCPRAAGTTAPTLRALPAEAHPAGTGWCCCTAAAARPGRRSGRRRPLAGRWPGGPAGSPRR